MADTPVSPKVAAGTVAAAVTTLAMYLLSLVPFVAAMPAAAQGALLVVVTAAVTYGAGYVTRDALRAVPRHRTRVADPGPEAGAISSDMVLAVFIGAFLAGVALWVLGELVGRM